MMTAVTASRDDTELSALLALADDFAARAVAQEVCRDRAHPGTVVHHQYAHSATLWRSAERALRVRALELASERPTSTAMLAVIQPPSTSTT